MKLVVFTKWRALLSAMLLALITGFLYGKGAASKTVLIALTLGAIAHIVVFYYLLLKELKYPEKKAE